MEGRIVAGVKDVGGWEVGKKYRGEGKGYGKGRGGET